MRIVGIAAALLLLAGTARADIRFGVAGDTGKYGDDSGSFFYKALDDVGFTENRVTIRWDPFEPGGFNERAFLDRSLPIASLHGIEVIFDVYPARPKAFATNTEERIDLFADFLHDLATEYPQVTTYIVGNEPNQPRFWQPQFVGGKAVAAARFEHLLAASYDALKSVNPEIVVAGVGLSPRGNDSPRAPNNVSRSPVRFIRDMAAEYRRTKRTRPIMDRLAFHPYPNSNDDPLARGYTWPNAGMRELDRIKQAVWDGFHGSGQPVVADSGRGGLRLVLDEYGRQVAIAPDLDPLYFGVETVPTISEGEQASIYRSVLRQVACDPAVSDFFLFHMVDERDLDRFQTGLLRADLTERLSYDVVKTTLAALAGGCGDTMRRWRHTSSVLGGRAAFVRGAVRVTAAEEVTVRVIVVRAGPNTTPDTAASSVPRVVRPRTTRVVGYSTALAPGRYVPRVVVQATMNPERKRLFVGPAFAVP